MGPAIQAAFMAMSHVGGKLLVFQSCLPTLGAGRLMNRDDTRASPEASKEHLLRGPVDSYFKKTSAECSRHQICIDLYTIAAPFSDLASMAVLCKYTGGEMRHYPGFTLEKDGAKFEKELKNNLTRFTAWEAVCRVRCSRGFRICAFNGHFFIRSMDLLALPATDGDKAYGVHIAHDEVVPSTNISYLQCALLYTSAEGERRIRVHTMAVPVVTDIAEMYRAVDCGAMGAFMARLGVERTLSVRLSDARDAVMTKVVATLREFKLLNTQAARAFNRLIYPESMKLLPLFAFAAFKSAAMRGGARDVPVDARIANIYDIMSTSTEEILKLLYPTMHALHSMPKESGTKDEYDRVILPPRTVLAGDRSHRRTRCLLSRRRSSSPLMARQDARTRVRRRPLRPLRPSERRRGLRLAPPGQRPLPSRASRHRGHPRQRLSRASLSPHRRHPGSSQRDAALPVPRRGSRARQRRRRRLLRRVPPRPPPPRQRAPALIPTSTDVDSHLHARDHRSFVRSFRRRPVSCNTYNNALRHQSQPTPGPPCPRGRPRARVVPSASLEASRHG